ncbi:MAG: preprotein translocase subunit SecE [Phycisphaerales bacterium JB040]
MFTTAGTPIDGRAPHDRSPHDMIGIRKPGQGYWVRVCSVVFWAAVVAAAAGYAWNQAQLVPVPTVAFTFNAPQIDDEIQAGDIVSLLQIDAEGGDDQAFGTALVQSVMHPANASGSITISNVSLTSETDYAGNAVRLVEGDTSSPAGVAILQPRSATPIPAYPQVYLQAGAAGGVLLLGAIALLWTHGSHRRIVDFLIATDGEMRKVNWTTRKQIQGSTIVVIVATFLIAAFLFAFDSLFSAIFTQLDVLQT